MARSFSAARVFRLPHLLVLGAALIWAGFTARPSAQDLPQGTYQAPNQGAPPPADATQVDWSDDVPAHIAIVDGAVSLERDGKVDNADENIPLLAGDRLTTQRGRTEVLFADGSALDLDEETSVDLLSDSLVRLRSGRLRLSIARQTEDLEYRVDAAGVSALIRTAGEYRVSLGGARSANEVDLAVIRGTAELANDIGRTLVRAGTHAVATERTEPSVPYAFNSSSWDPFEQWVESLRADRYGATSSQYLPSDMRSYSGVFDNNGAWNYDSSYGYVWYPRVDVGWRPYSVGRWSFVGSFGWTWVGFDRWSWPTHHYGRWGQRGTSWFWIPDRRWSPAWVSWAYAPDYVSWCPLGFDNRPLVSISVVASRGFSPWTILPVREFRSNVIVSRHAVPFDRVGASVFSQFSVRNVGPAAPLGVRTSVAPLRSPSFGTRNFSTRQGVAQRGSTGTVPRSGGEVRPLESRGNPASQASPQRQFGSRQAVPQRNDQPASRVDPRTQSSGDPRSSIDRRTNPGAAPSSRGVDAPRSVPSPRSVDPRGGDGRSNAPSRESSPAQQRGGGSVWGSRSPSQQQQSAPAPSRQQENRGNVFGSRAPQPESRPSEPVQNRSLGERRGGGTSSESFRSQQPSARPAPEPQAQRRFEPRQEAPSRPAPSVQSSRAPSRESSRPAPSRSQSQSNDRGRGSAARRGGGL